MQRVKTLSKNTHDLFTTQYQEYQARPGSMSVPVKSWQIPEGKWEPNLVSGGKESVVTDRILFIEPM